MATYSNGAKKEYVSPWGIPANYASPYLNPEDMLIAAEESEPEEPEDVELSRDSILKALSRLSLVDQDLVQHCVLGTTRQSDYAKILGISQAGVSYRVLRVYEKLKWFCGVGGTFTPLELRRVLEGHMEPRFIAWLVCFWLTGNTLETARRLRLSKHTWFQAVRAIRPLAQLATDKPELFGRYYEGIAVMRRKRIKLHFVQPPVLGFRGFPPGHRLSQEAKDKLANLRRGRTRRRTRV